MRSAQSFSAASRPRVYGQQQHRMVVVRYEDLRLIQQIGEGGFGKVRAHNCTCMQLQMWPLQLACTPRTTSALPCLCALHTSACSTWPALI